MPITAIVTGGAGFIGSHVADGLLARGDRVAVVDDLSSGKRERVPAGAELHQIDIRDAAALRALVADVRPAGDLPPRRPGRRARLGRRPGPRRRRQRARHGRGARGGPRVGDARVVFSSTGGAIYGEVDAIPSPETTPCAAMAPYGVAKLCGEHYVELYNRLYGTSHVILRYGNVYGPRQDPHGEAGVVAIFFGKLTAGETPLVFGDGSQTRDYVYVGDVVAANLAALDYGGAHADVQHRHRRPRRA